MNRSMRRFLSPRGTELRAALLLTIVGLLLPAAGAAQEESADAHLPAADVAPPRGTVIVAGGGTLPAEIWERFVELAGGPDARIVVIPTAGTDDEYGPDWEGLDPLRAAGARDITVLHTRNPRIANGEDFVAPLERASGVWMPGGRQWRLVDAYLHTRVHEELFRVLERGGVVGGTSAGASIQGSFLVRGDPATNQVIISPEYTEGFGLLPGTAVDQHLLAREREEDLWEVLSRDPELLGIGVDEGTAVVIQADTAEVVGTSRVLIYDATSPVPRTPFILEPGYRFDLRGRSALPSGVAEDLEHESHGGLLH